MCQLDDSLDDFLVKQTQPMELIPPGIRIFQNLEQLLMLLPVSRPISRSIENCWYLLRALPSKYRSESMKSNQWVRVAGIICIIALNGGRSNRELPALRKPFWQSSAERRKTRRKNAGRAEKGGLHRYKDCTCSYMRAGSLHIYGSIYRPAKRETEKN